MGRQQIKPFLLGIATVCAALLVAPLHAGLAAQRSNSSRPSTAHWQLLAASRVSGEPIKVAERYRLVTVGGQLTVNSKVFEGLRLIRPEDSTENLAVHGQPGGVVQLNMPVALYLYHRTTYVIHKKGRDFNLGLADWNPSREPPLPKPRGVEQWEFRSAPNARVRDHRRRGIATQEELGLFNTNAKAYLVYDRERRTLGWSTSTAREQ